MLAEDKVTEHIIDHEIRIRLQEKTYTDLKKEVKDIHNLIRWMFGTIIISILIPIGLKYFNLN